MLPRLSVAVALFALIVVLFVLVLAGASLAPGGQPAAAAPDQVTVAGGAAPGVYSIDYRRPG